MTTAMEAILAIWCGGLTLVCTLLVVWLVFLERRVRSLESESLRHHLNAEALANLMRRQADRIDRSVIRNY